MIFDRADEFLLPYVNLFYSNFEKFADDDFFSLLTSALLKTSFSFFWINHQHNTKRVTKNFLLSLFIRTMGTHGTLCCVFCFLILFYGLKLNKRWWFLAFLGYYIKPEYITSPYDFRFCFIVDEFSAKLVFEAWLTQVENCEQTQLSDVLIH